MIVSRQESKCRGGQALVFEGARADVQSKLVVVPDVSKVISEGRWLTKDGNTNTSLSLSYVAYSISMQSTRRERGREVHLAGFCDKR